MCATAGKPSRYARGSARGRMSMARKKAKGKKKK
jgi:hypothetical protein